MATLTTGSKYDLVIVQGATFIERFNWKDSSKVAIPLTNYTARLQIRNEVDSTSTLLELTTENSRITLNTPNVGDITLKLTSTDTAALTFNTGVYDLELIHIVGQESVVDNILYGTVSVRKNITR